MNYDEIKAKVESFISGSIDEKANYEHIISRICNYMSRDKLFSINEGNGLLTISWVSSLNDYLKKLLDRSQVPSNQSLQISVSNGNTISIFDVFERQGQNNEIIVTKGEEQMQISGNGYLLDTSCQTICEYQLDGGILKRDRSARVERYDENSVKQSDEQYIFCREKFENQPISLAFYYNWGNWQSKYEEIESIHHYNRSANFWEAEITVEHLNDSKRGQFDKEKMLLDAHIGFQDFNFELMKSDELSPEELERHIEFGIANTRIRNERAAKAFEEDYKKWKESTNISTKGVNKR